MESGNFGFIFPCGHIQYHLQVEVELGLDSLVPILMLTITMCSFFHVPGLGLSHDVSCGQSESVLNMPRVLAVVVDVMIAIEAGITIVVIVEVDVVGTTG